MNIFQNRCSKCHASNFGRLYLPVNSQRSRHTRAMLSFSSTCQSESRLVGKTVVITGANSGIGKETARDLYSRGARVILACRSIEKANLAAKDIEALPPSRPGREQFRGGPGNLGVYELDLSSVASIRNCAKNLIEKEARIDILINNAGVLTRFFEKTEDGFECQLQVNYLGPFLLTLLLLPKLKSSTPGVRIINVSSYAHYTGSVNFDDLNLEESFTPTKAYAQSKLCTTLFTRELARRLEEANIGGITVYSVNPGVVDTDIARHWDTTFFRSLKCIFHKLIQPFLKTAELGAQTILHCALDENAAKESGLFYKECAVNTPSLAARNNALALRLWNESSKLLGLEGQDQLVKM